jgi:hypothetical protein
MGKQCYGGNQGKSMKAVELAAYRKDCWRKIAISLFDLDFWRTNGASW